ncbi:type II secretion system GspH family protein [Bacillus sp. RAR_GA_16]|uniref:type II secretion system GspH family protein n=1 Tax=Bacillus sp. RAR_GA_16 TaxID=2876774 RepID=UPI001CCF22DC|nr:type II secretion system GspH family protein [Bacillus sp. RAR_GA_16]MCA0171092.1 hypothetical protein [Bacillus sp. RAR_GA_16]
MWYRWGQVASILKSCKGYSLLDALIALSILTVLSSSVLPLYTHLYGERITIDKRKQAVILLDHYWNDLVLNRTLPPKEEIVEGVAFSIKESPTQLCVSYNEQKKNDNVICRSLPHEE